MIHGEPPEDSDAAPPREPRGFLGRRQSSREEEEAATQREETERQEDESETCRFIRSGQICCFLNVKVERLTERPSCRRRHEEQQKVTSKRNKNEVWIQKQNV